MKRDAILDKKVRRLVLLCVAVAMGLTVIGVAVSANATTGPSGS